MARLALLCAGVSGALTGYSDLMVVQDGQSLHSFCFTVKLQQTRQSLTAGCWEEGEEEEMER